MVNDEGNKGMWWKIFGFVALISLTSALVAVEVENPAGHYDLFFSAQEVPPTMQIGNRTLSFVNDSISFETFEFSTQTLSLMNESFYFLNMSSDLIINLRAYCQIATVQQIKVSDDYCPIRDWAESMYRNNRVHLFYVTFQNDTYGVNLWEGYTGPPSNMNWIIFILTVALWGAFLWGVIWKTTDKTKRIEHVNKAESVSH